MKEMKAAVVLYPQADGGYTVICPELRLTSQGETIDEAVSMIKDLIEDYFENIPPDDFTKEELIEAYNSGGKIFMEISV